jgi:hypothetical protein
VTLFLPSISAASVTVFAFFVFNKYNTCILSFPEPVFSCLSSSLSSASLSDISIL